MAVKGTSRYFSYKEVNLIAPPDSENERVSCCCRKTYWLKLRSVVLHVRCTRPRPAPVQALGAGRGREYEMASPRARVDNIARMHQRMRASN